MNAPRVVLEKSDSKGNMVAIWSCNCVTSRIGDKFYITPCKHEGCPVFGEVLKQTRDRGNKLEVKLL